MATKKNQTTQLQKTVTVLKEKATQLNEELLIASDELIDGSITTGEKVQDMMAKALKNGTFLLGKQQELALDTIETLIGQYKTGNVKFRKLLGFDKYTARKAKAKKNLTKAVNKKKGQIKAKTTSTIEAILADDKPVVKKTNKKKSTTKKAKATRRAKTATSKITNTDLTVIEGIGPKIASILNKAGIKTFDQLAKKEVAELKEILAKAGKRYNAHDPTTWGQQAELAAAGKWEVLKAWKNRLKGGVSDSGKRVVVL